jgi:hypothetical protein
LIIQQQIDAYPGQNKKIAVLKMAQRSKSRFEPKPAGKGKIILQHFTLNGKNIFLL